jgi:hypothetical protein
MKSVAVFGLLFAVAIPALAQSTEFGAVFGGSRRMIYEDDRDPDTNYDLPGFQFSNSSIEVYYGTELDPGTWFKLKLGRIQTPVAFKTPQPVDVEGEMQHLDAVVEYGFSEPYGYTGLFAGLGFYRQEASGVGTETDWGYSVGLHGDFPLSRRYGIVVESSFHWARTEVRQRFLTAGAGLRMRF